MVWALRVASEGLKLLYCGNTYIINQQPAIFWRPLRSQQTYIESNRFSSIAYRHTGWRSVVSSMDRSMERTVEIHSNVHCVVGFACGAHFGIEVGVLKLSPNLKVNFLVFLLLGSCH